jgi:hypothetical protein
MGQGVNDRMRRAAHRVPRAADWPRGLEAAETAVLATNRFVVLALAANASPSRDGGADATSNLHCLPGRICCGLAMYITDLTHFLDKSGAIGPVKGPAPTMAQFHVDAVAHASDSTSETLPAPKCFKCKKSVVEVALAQDNAVVWACPKCRIEGRISNWQGSLWDLRSRPPTSG